MILMNSTTGSFPVVSRIIKTPAHLNNSGEIPKGNTNRVEKWINGHPECASLFLIHFCYRWIKLHHLSNWYVTFDCSRGFNVCPASYPFKGKQNIIQTYFCISFSMIKEERFLIIITRISLRSFPVFGGVYNLSYTIR